MNGHPVQLAVTDDLQRSRLTVFFRLLLAIPHFIWLLLWSVAAFFADIERLCNDGHDQLVIVYRRQPDIVNAV